MNEKVDKEGIVELEKKPSPSKDPVSSDEDEEDFNIEEELKKRQ
jgi:hypothetical protein